MKRAALFLSLVLLGVTSGWSQQPDPNSLTPDQRATVIKEVSSVVTERAFVPGVDLDKWPEHLKAHQERIDNATTKGALSIAINRALREFGISHIRFRIAREPSTGANADWLLVRQSGQGAPQKPEKTESLSWEGEDVAVLKVRTFADAYDRRNVNELMDQVRGKAKILVLDLRSNGGGSTNNLQHLLSQVMKSGTDVGTFVGRRTVRQYQEETKKDGTDPVAVAKWSTRKFRAFRREGEPFSGKIAVLVNRRSASASEICAAACREVLKAPIVGSRTAGAVLASTFAKISHGFELQYPISDYVTIGGVRLEGNPLQPDLEAVAQFENGKDLMVARAIELVKKQGS